MYQTMVKQKHFKVLPTVKLLNRINLLNIMPINFDIRLICLWYLFQDRYLFIHDGPLDLYANFILSFLHLAQALHQTMKN